MIPLNHHYAPSANSFRYNDPSFVKVKKLEVLTEVCSVNIVESIMDELV